MIFVYRNLDLQLTFLLIFNSCWPCIVGLDGTLQVILLLFIIADQHHSLRLVSVAPRDPCGASDGGDILLQR